MWRFLGLWGADYVRWRFGPADATDVDHAAGTERFDGPDTKQAFARLRVELQLDASDAQMLAAMNAWTQLFGLVSFEVFGQTRGLIDDHEAFLRESATAMATRVGLT